MSTELVPYTEYRNQQESLNGTPNLYHNSQLSPADAERINSSVGIVAYAGDHGTPGIVEARRKQYQEMQAVVAGLDPARGDVLFVERLGHDTSNPHYSLAQEDLAQDAHRGMARRTMSTFAYAAQLAAAKGIPVVYADMDAEQYAAFKQLAGKDNPEMDPRYDKDMSRVRERQAVNAVKDYALKALPNLKGQKPTYALLFGAGHFDSEKPSSIPTAFSELGLDVKTELLTQSSYLRVRYQLGRTALRTLGTELGKVKDAMAKNAKWWW